MSVQDGVGALLRVNELHVAVLELATAALHGIAVEWCGWSMLVQKLESLVQLLAVETPFKVHRPGPVLFKGLDGHTR